MKKIVILLVLITLIIGLTACNNKAESLVDEPLERIETPEVLRIIKGYKSLTDSFIDYKFEVSEGHGSFIITGEYDLNNDGEVDQIEMVLQKHSNKIVETYIKVNGINQESYMDYTDDGEVHLVDLDKNDGFIDIAFFDEGPSGDPHYQIYRYDGEELYNLGGLYDECLVNGEGRIIPSSYMSDFEPAFYSAWLEIYNNEFIVKEKDIDEYLGKEYTLNIDNKVDSIFFDPMEEMPESFNPAWEDPRKLETTKLTLIDIMRPSYDNNILNFYFVELSSGEKGLLYFWIGD